jgi:hypothetical protein
MKASASYSALQIESARAKLDEWRAVTDETAGLA